MRKISLILLIFRFDFLFSRQSTFFFLVTLTFVSVLCINESHLRSLRFLRDVQQSHAVTALVPGETTTAAEVEGEMTIEAKVGEGVTIIAVKVE